MIYPILSAFFNFKARTLVACHGPGGHGVMWYSISCALASSAGSKLPHLC